MEFHNIHLFLTAQGQSQGGFHGLNVRCAAQACGFEQLVLFWASEESLGCGTQLEDVGCGRWSLRFYRPSLPVLTLLPGPQSCKPPATCFYSRDLQVHRAASKQPHTSAAMASRQTRHQAFFTELGGKINLSSLKFFVVRCLVRNTNKEITTDSAFKLFLEWPRCTSELGLPGTVLLSHSLIHWMGPG